MEATQLDFVGLAAGSAVLEVEAHEAPARLFDDADDLVERSMERLVAGLDELTTNPDRLPDGFDRGVVNGLVNLTGSVGGRVSAIEFVLGDSPTVVVDGRTKAAVRAARRRLEEEPIEITGRLHMGDFAPSTLRCRIDTAEGPVTCDFDEDLRTDVLSAMDRIVVAQGLAEYWPGESRPRLLHLDALSQVQEAEEILLEEVIRQQGIAPVSNVEELVGPAIDDFDAFLAAVRSVRGR